MLDHMLADRTRVFGLVRLMTIVIAVALAGGIAVGQRATTPAFADRIATLSEPPGYFDTDNLISNEREYLSVIPQLARAQVHGGAYIGVGPDQNFSYIAAVRPSVALIIDIRRDNLLLHLLFKALFEQSRTRVEYLSQLTGRAVPIDALAWRARTVNDIVAYVDRSRVDETRVVDVLRSRLTATIQGYGLALTATDLATIDRFHRQFIAAGLGLRFQSTGRPPQSGYPTFRDLIVATDDTGRQSNYLASEDAFQFVKGLEARDLVIPVVGDLSGPKALKAIGGFVRERGERVSTFYASNVEFYLVREGTFPRFLDNLRALPLVDNATLIRSIFGGGGVSYSETAPIRTVIDGRR